MLNNKFNAPITRQGGSLSSTDVSATAPPLPSRRSHMQEDVRYWVMRRLHETPEINQRELAKELGISLGGINYCLQALVQKGWVKVHNFSHSRNKLGYAYLLTPAGLAEKSALTIRFLRRKMAEYEWLKAEISTLPPSESQNETMPHHKGHILNKLDSNADGKPYSV